jgi:hypothetical protein
MVGLMMMMMNRYPIPDEATKPISDAVRSEPNFKAVPRPNSDTYHDTEFI